jgi:hypothetical protein
MVVPGANEVRRPEPTAMKTAGRAHRMISAMNLMGSDTGSRAVQREVSRAGMRPTKMTVDGVGAMTTDAMGRRTPVCQGDRRKGKQQGRQGNHHQADQATEPLMVQMDQHGTPPWPAGHRNLQPNASGWGRMVMVTRRFMASLLEIGRDSP